MEIENENIRHIELPDQHYIEGFRRCVESLINQENTFYDAEKKHLENFIWISHGLGSGKIEVSIDQFIVKSTEKGLKMYSFDNVDGVVDVELL